MEMAYTETELERLETLINTYCWFKKQAVFEHVWRDAKAWPEDIEFYDKLFLDGYLSRKEWFETGVRHTAYIIIPSRCAAVRDAVEAETFRKKALVWEVFGHGG